MKTRGFTPATLITLLLIGSRAWCQDPATKEADTTFYKSYTDYITARYYFSQKYTSMTMTGKGTDNSLQYRPNTNLNMGVGVTYGWFTLNLAFGFPFLNGGDGSKVKTKYLDAQSHIYTSKYIVDLAVARYKGYYLFPEGEAMGIKGGYYQRPDLKVGHIGISAYKVMNWKKYSFRAAMMQNEWQKKSAGSILLGAEVYYSKTASDSSLIPTVLQEDFNQSGIRKIRCIDIGPGAGYAYTLVFAKHYFVMGSATCTLPLDWLIEYKEGAGGDAKVSVGPNLSYRAALGYNTPRWGVSALWVNNSLDSKGESGGYHVQTGNVRLNIAYRFMPGKRLQRKIRFFSFD